MTIFDRQNVNPNIWPWIRSIRYISLSLYDGFDRFLDWLGLLSELLQLDRESHHFTIQKSIGFGFPVANTRWGELFDRELHITGA